MQPIRSAQSGDQGVVFGLVVGIVVAQLEPLQALGAVLGAGDGIAAIAQARVALAAAVENEQVVGRPRARGNKGQLRGLGEMA